MAISPAPLSQIMPLENSSKWEGFVSICVCVWFFSFVESFEFNMSMKKTFPLTAYSINCHYMYLINFYSQLFFIYFCSKVGCEDSLQIMEFHLWCLCGQPYHTYQLMMFQEGSQGGFSVQIHGLLVHTQIGQSSR